MFVFASLYYATFICFVYKEQLGGYYLLDCKDLDEAISWAAKIPSAQYGSIEVRPLNQWSQNAQR